MNTHILGSARFVCSPTCGFFASELCSSTFPLLIHLGLLSTSSRHGSHSTSEVAQICIKPVPLLLRQLNPPMQEACLKAVMLKSKVGEVMSSPAVTLSPEKTVLDAATLMLKKKVHRIPILNEKQQVVGIVTRTDVFQALEA